MPETPASTPGDPPSTGSDDTATTPPGPQRARRVVLAGDDWAAGLSLPLRAAVDARGFADVALSWETTVHAGSQAAAWRVNARPDGAPDPDAPGMLDALIASLDADPPADVLVLLLGAHDFHRELDGGWGLSGPVAQEQALDGIESDIAAVVDAAWGDRPDLRVVMVGYDAFHFELVRLLVDVSGLDQTSYNEALVEVGRRARQVAEARPGVAWTHHFGLLQHRYGDTIHPPFPIPNPAAGFPEYVAGVAPAPGPYPDYEPFPGGFLTYPPPLEAVPDGLHPTADAFGAIADAALDQVLERWLAGLPPRRPR